MHTQNQTDQANNTTVEPKTNHTTTQRKNYQPYAAFEPTVFKYNENNIGAVYHKRSDEWLGKLQKRAGGSRAYQEAIKRGQGTFPHP